MNTKMNFNQKVVDMRESITYHYNLCRAERRLMDKYKRYKRLCRKWNIEPCINYRIESEHGDIVKAMQISVDKLSDIADIGNINKLVARNAYSIESMYISYAREIPESISHNPMFHDDMNLNRFESDFDKMLDTRNEKIFKFLMYIELCKKEKGKKTAFYILFNTCKLPIELIKEISQYS